MSIGNVYPVGNYFKIEFRYNPKVVAAVKELPDRRFDHNDKSWTVPLQYRDAVERFCKRYNLQFGHKIEKPVIENFTNPPLPELTIEIPLKRQPRPYQRTGVAYAIDKQRTFFGDDMGLGKQNVNGTPVLSEYGWKPIETLEFGDLVFGRDGFLHFVTGVFPQGERDIYRMTFSDGTFSDVGLEHLWAVRTLNDRRRKGKWRVLDTETLANDLYYANGCPKWEIPLVDPIFYPERNVTIPPYIMGVLIADGSLTASGLTFVPGDLEVPELVEELLPEYIQLNKNADYGTSTRYSLVSPGTSRNYWRDRIKFFELDKVSYFKFIPEIYLKGSIHQRKELLAGLLDCDGTVRGARVRYSTSSKKLAENVKELVQSLGGIATIYVVKGRERIREGKLSIEEDNYNVGIRTSFNPFKRESNRKKWKVSSKLIRQIVSVEFLKKDHATCISVSAPDSLYIVKDYIVTHNTFQAIASIEALHMQGKAAYPCLIVCPSAVKENWKREIEETVNRKAIVLSNATRQTFQEFFRTGLAHYFIVNYESLKKFFVEHIDDPGIDKNGKKRKPTLKHYHFRKKSIDFYKSIIFDESHKLKAVSTMASKISKGISTGKETIFLLTGTPLINKPNDLIAQLGIMNRLVELGGYKHFVDRYCSGPNGASNLKELNFNLNKTCFFRRNKTDPEVKKYLPDKSRQVILCDLNRESRKEYDHAMANLESYMKQYKQASDEKIQQSMKGEVMVRIGILKNISARGKLKDAFDFVQELIDSGQKVVVFANLIEIVAAVQKAFPRSVRLTGAENAVQKQASVDSFRTNDNVDVIVLNLKAGGVGVNGLQDVATNVCFIEFGWHAAIMDQAEDRLYRMGQHSNVMCTYFLGRDTIDEWNYDLIQKKREIANTVTGNDDQTEVSIVDSFATLFSK